MFDVSVGGGPFLRERRPCYPRRSHSRFFLGFYLCLLLPEVGSKSEIETLAREELLKSANTVWSTRTNNGNGMTVLDDEETEVLQYRHDNRL